MISKILFIFKINNRQIKLVTIFINLIFYWSLFKSFKSKYLLNIIVMSLQDFLIVKTFLQERLEDGSKVGRPGACLIP